MAANHLLHRRHTLITPVRASLITGCVLLVTGSAYGTAQPFSASGGAAALDPQIDWSRARLIVVQDGGRYKTLESFARETMGAMYGAEHLPGLSPVASCFEILFNRDAYLDTPLVRIRDRGVQIHLSAHMPAAERDRIQSSGFMTPRELADETVLARMRELEARFDMTRAIGRVRNAQTVALALPRLFRIVPQPGDDPHAPWHTPDELRSNVAALTPEGQKLSAAELESRFGTPIDGITPEQAAPIVGSWGLLQTAWLAGDATAVQARLDRLADVLPTLAAPGAYPKLAQRNAEARYYAWGKFTWGYWLYFVGILISIWALLTRWRVPWLIALTLLVAALGLHAYGVGLRWYILGRIPVANMFEAITASAWVGIAFALVIELIYRARVFVLAAHVTGFFALLLATLVLPGELTSIMGILDDLMLRIHTTLIISSYALIFLAAVIAVVYLVGYYVTRLRQTGIADGPSLAALAPGVAGFMSAGLTGQRPLMAGALPGDEGRRTELPEWLHRMDWCHLIILNIMFVMLFVGVILGAVWADYSWGRPWGWDPKEVFAMNTWLVYAVLIHLRLIVRNKGLWTAWLSVGGCAMMAFNWWVVNFYIVGLHSYA